ncbi:MAG: SIMPL domain-containing protein [Balneola sp.]|nr:MAG: SIMPL domain-containing protein [Balneola sp.]
MRYYITFYLVICFSMIVNAQEAKNSHFIEVIGEAKLEVVPNLIYLTATIDGRSFKQEDILKKENELLKVLQNSGLDLEEDLYVSDVQSELVKYWFKSDKFVPTKNYQITAHSYKQAIEVIFELSELEIYISIEKFDHSEIEEYKKNLEIKAIQDAKEKAEYLTESIGQSIGKAIYIIDNNSNFGFVMSDYDSFGLNSHRENIRGSRERYPELSFKKISLNSRILARFELD